MHLLNLVSLYNGTMGTKTFFSFGIILVTALLIPVFIGERAQNEFVSNDPFVLGMYYFNADEDTHGPYDLVKARAHFEAVIAENPRGNAEVWYQLGRIDFLEGDFSAAIERFKTQIEYFGDTQPAAHYMLGLTYAYRARGNPHASDWQRAEKSFLHFNSLAPMAPWSRVDLAWIYFSQGKYQEMIPVLEEGLMYNSTNPWLLNMYGLALLNTDDIVRAQDAFAEAHEYASVLTVSEWGASYPGNDPASWEEGLVSFREVIAHNLEVTRARMQ